MKICRFQDEIELITERHGRQVIFRGRWRCPRSGKVGQDTPGVFNLACRYVNDCKEFQPPISDLERFRTWLVQFLRGRLARWR